MDEDNDRQGGGGQTAGRRRGRPGRFRLLDQGSSDDTGLTTTRLQTWNTTGLSSTFPGPSRRHLR